MEKIDVIKSRAVAVPVDNIDTDQIIPARFLKTTVKEGFGEKLFYDWRFDSEGKPVRSVLSGQSGSILVAGNNFGCGSSREHAAWAISDAGFRAVISSSFADIFRNNALNNGIVPVKVTEGFLAEVFRVLVSEPETIVTVDLGRQLVSVPGAGEEMFEINAYKKECLMKGYTDIDYILSDMDAVSAFEKKASCLL